MAENSKIEWTTHTFNPVRGCVEVSEGCANCYAATMSLRNPALLGTWGRFGTRIAASADMWKQPLKWNAAAGAAKHEADWSSDNPVIPPPRPRVFCASLADVFEDWPGRLHFPAKDDDGKPTIDVAYWSPVKGLIKAGQTTPHLSAGERHATMQDMRDQLFRLIESTPNLDWLLLTKRPQNVMRMVPKSWQTKFPDNVWMGTTVENQERADERIPILLSIPAKVRFLSCEPLLGHVFIRPQAFEAFHFEDGEPSIHWVICGGESGGPQARPMHPDWARSLRDQCAAAGVSFFFKQWGEYESEIRPGTTVEMVSLQPGESVGWGDGKTNHTLYRRVGKAKAGRLLDGIEHNGFPKLEGRGV